MGNKPSERAKGTSTGTYIPVRGNRYVGRFHVFNHSAGPVLWLDYWGFYL
jgi:hypothetical protein